jgi:hypothetical protein
MGTQHIAVNGRHLNRTIPEFLQRGQVPTRVYQLAKKSINPLLSLLKRGAESEPATKRGCVVVTKPHSPKVVELGAARALSNHNVTKAAWGVCIPRIVKQRGKPQELETRLLSNAGGDGRRRTQKPQIGTVISERI